jgi:hypothetical protein
MTIVTGADGGFTGDGDDEHGYFIVSEGSFTAPNWLFWKLYYPKTKKAYEYRATLQADGNEIYGTYLDSAEGGSNKFMLSRVSLPGKEFDLVQSACTISRSVKTDPMILFTFDSTWLLDRTVQSVRSTAWILQWIYHSHNLGDGCQWPFFGGW